MGNTERYISTTQEIAKVVPAATTSAAVRRFSNWHLKISATVFKLGLLKADLESLILTWLLHAFLSYSQHTTEPLMQPVSLEVFF